MYEIATRRKTLKSTSHDLNENQKKEKEIKPWLHNAFISLTWKG